MNTAGWAITAVFFLAGWRPSLFLVRRILPGHVFLVYAAAFAVALFFVFLQGRIALEIPYLSYAWIPSLFVAGFEGGRSAYLLKDKSRFDVVNAFVENFLIYLMVSGLFIGGLVFVLILADLMPIRVGYL